MKTLRNCNVNRVNVSIFELLSIKKAVEFYSLSTFSKLDYLTTRIVFAVDCLLKMSVMLKRTL